MSAAIVSIAPYQKPAQPSLDEELRILRLMIETYFTALHNQYDKCAGLAKSQNRVKAP